MYLGTSPLPLPPAPPQIGIWAVLHEVRSEYAQLMSVLFLLSAGPGPWSIDGMLARAKLRWARGAPSLDNDPAVRTLFAELRSEEAEHQAMVKAVMAKLPPESAETEAFEPDEPVGH
jgi:hypothetical protein